MKQFGSDSPSVLYDPGSPQLSASAVEEAFKHFSAYDFVNGHPFHKPWHDALTGLVIKGEVLTFEDGGICVVDAIKCPTLRNIGGWHGEEAKKVAKNCGKTVNRFLLRQIAFHKPPVLIFAGTQSLAPAADRGGKNRTLLQKALDPYIKDVRTSEPPSSRRLYIELDRANGLKQANPNALRRGMLVVLKCLIAALAGNPSRGSVRKSNDCRTPTPLFFFVLICRPEWGASGAAVSEYLQASTTVLTGTPSDCFPPRRCLRWTARNFTAIESDS